MNPTLTDVKNYCSEKDSGVDPERFFEYYDTRDWTTGGEPIRNWKALFDAWDKTTPKKEKEKKGMGKNYNKMATMDDPEFSAYVEWFSKDGWKKIIKKVSGGNLNAQ